ncbi:MAG: response regulator [Candidatus Thiodiazotropha sp.]
MDNLTPKPHVLFVDDEPNLLSGLKRSLRGQRNEWEMSFAGSGEEALELINNQPVDVVVSDMWMPGISGAELLNAVARQQPQTIRFVLSGHSDEQSILSLIDTAHRFIAKPCDAETLKSLLKRAFMLQEILQDPSLTSVISNIDSLPSCPAVYQELTKKLRSDTATLHEIGRLIAQDPPISAKMLQMVNSSFFGIGRRVSSPEEAASLLGMDLLKSLVLSAGVFRQFEEAGHIKGAVNLTNVWRHSIAVGCLARDIVKAEGGDKHQVEDAMAAGLLHDIGLLLFVFKLPEVWQKIQDTIAEQGIPHWEAELQVTGAPHCRLGGYLLGLWGLPETMVEAVAYTHWPEMAPTQSFSTLTAVHVADALLQNDQRLNQTYLAATGMEHKLPAWQALAEPIIKGCIS